MPWWKALIISLCWHVLGLGLAAFIHIPGLFLQKEQLYPPLTDTPRPDTSPSVLVLWKDENDSNSGSTRWDEPGESLPHYVKDIPAAAPIMPGIIPANTSSTLSQNDLPPAMPAHTNIEPDPTPLQAAVPSVQHIPFDPVKTDHSASAPGSASINPSTDSNHTGGGYASENAAAGGHTQGAGIPSGSLTNVPATIVDEDELWRVYNHEISLLFRKKKYYPEMARKLGHQGTVWIEVRLRRDGTQITADIGTSSGSAILDQAALKAAQSTMPLPPFPEKTQAKEKTIRIPYRFRLDEPSM